MSALGGSALVGGMVSAKEVWHYWNELSTLKSPV